MKRTLILVIFFLAMQMMYGAVTKVWTSSVSTSTDGGKTWSDFVELKILIVIDIENRSVITYGKPTCEYSIIDFPKDDAGIAMICIDENGLKCRLFFGTAKGGGRYVSINGKTMIMYIIKD